MRGRFETALLTATAMLVMLACSQSFAQDSDASLYVGIKKCKMCHKKEENGNQYQKWLDGPHAKTFETLAGEKAQKVAAELGIDDPQASGKCLKCHSTAYNWTEEVQTDAIAVEEGVVCESCHGPGANYKKKAIMKDRDESIANGLVYPATKNCELCHNEDNPVWDPEKYTKEDGSKVGFDVDQAFEEIKHPNPNVTHE